MSISGTAESVVIQQRGRKIGPISPRELSWLNQNGYVNDTDQVVGSNGRIICDVYEQLNAYIRQGIAIFIQPCQVTCPVCGTPFEIRELGTPAWCPDCGEEISEGVIGAQVQRRPRRELVLGGHRLALMRGSDWVQLLLSHPEFGRLAIWDSFRGEDFFVLLQKAPGFADKCRWNLLNHDQWERLIEAGVAKEEWMRFSELPPARQLPELKKNPRLAGFVYFQNYSIDEWVALLSEVPELGFSHPEWKEKCSVASCRKYLRDPKVPLALKGQFPLDLLDGKEWFSLLAENPSLAPVVPWKQFLSAIQRISAVDAPQVKGADGDEALSLNENQHSAEGLFPHLWEQRKTLWELGGAVAQKALSRKDFWLLGDFLGWENFMPLPAEGVELLDILAKHPDFGDANGIWEHLSDCQAWALLERSPSIWNRFSQRLARAPHEVWRRVFASCWANSHAEQILVKMYPLSWQDTLLYRHYGVKSLEQKILRRWYVFFAAMVALVVLLIICC